VTRWKELANGRSVLSVGQLQLVLRKRGRWNAWLINRGPPPGLMWGWSADASMSIADVRYETLMCARQWLQDHAHAAGFAENLERFGLTSVEKGVPAEDENYDPEKGNRWEDRGDGVVALSIGNFYVVVAPKGADDRWGVSLLFQARKTTELMNETIVGHGAAPARALHRVSLWLYRHADWMFDALRAEMGPPKPIRFAFKDANGNQVVRDTL
jgi:hypothetical protein